MRNPKRPTPRHITVYSRPFIFEGSIFMDSMNKIIKLHYIIKGHYISSSINIFSQVHMEHSPE